MHNLICKILGRAKELEVDPRMITSVCDDYIDIKYPNKNKTLRLYYADDIKILKRTFSRSNEILTLYHKNKIIYAVTDNRLETIISKHVTNDNSWFGYKVLT